MKKQIHIPTLSIIDVEDDLIECSICREYKLLEEYCSVDDKQKKTRTNCENCYKSTREVLEKFAIFENKNKKKIIDLKKILCKENELETSVVDVEVLIVKLQHLPKDSKVIIT